MGEQTACKTSELGYSDTMSDTETIILGSILTILGLVSFPYFKYAESCSIGRGVGWGGGEGDTEISYMPLCLAVNSTHQHLL